MTYTLYIHVYMDSVSCGEHPHMYSDHLNGLHILILHIRTYVYGDIIFACYICYIRWIIMWLVRMNDIIYIHILYYTYDLYTHSTHQYTLIISVYCVETQCKYKRSLIYDSYILVCIHICILYTIRNARIIQFKRTSSHNYLCSPGVIYLLNLKNLLFNHHPNLIEITECTRAHRQQ